MQKYDKLTFSIEGMLYVMDVVDLVTLLINIDQEEMKGITGLDREMLCAMIATNPITLQDFVDERMWTGRVR